MMSPLSLSDDLVLFLMMSLHAPLRCQILAAYKALMERLLSMLGVHNATQKSHEILQLETSLANVSAQSHSAPSGHAVVRQCHWLEELPSMCPCTLTKGVCLCVSLDICMYKRIGSSRFMWIWNYVKNIIDWNFWKH